MQIYTITKVSKMGESHPEYGQTWWATAKETDFPVMFNTKAGYVGLGQVITAEEQERKTSAKGTEYLRLKKVKLAEKEEAPKEAPTPGGGQFKLIYAELRAIRHLLEKLNGEERADKVDPEDEWIPRTDEADEMPEDFLQ